MLTVRLRGRGEAPYGWLLFGGTFLALWLLLDLRIGLELMSYSVTDLRTYAFADESDRLLRTHEDLYAILPLAVPVLQEQERFALLTQRDTPDYANVRYQSYPAVPVPVHAPEDGEGLRLWFVLRRPDASVDDTGRIVLRTKEGALPLSPPGKIIKRLHDGSFLFETTP
jgi:hypothetical protein